MHCFSASNHSGFVTSLCVIKSWITRSYANGFFFRQVLIEPVKMEMNLFKCDKGSANFYIMLFQYYYIWWNHNDQDQLLVLGCSLHETMIIDLEIYCSEIVSGWKFIVSTNILYTSGCFSTINLKYICGDVCCTDILHITTIILCFVDFKWCNVYALYVVRASLYARNYCYDNKINHETINGVYMLKTCVHVHGY